MATPQVSSPQVASTATPMPDHLPHGIKGLMIQPWQMPLWWKIALGAALTALLFYALYRYWKKKQKPAEVIVPPEDPLLRVCRLLNQLTPPEPFVDKRKRDYFFELNLLFRELLELVTTVPATDLTLKELREPLRAKLPMSREQTEDVIRFLTRSEMIKFADVPTDRDEALTCHRKVLQWVGELVPRSGEGRMS